ncbi:ABC transporter substrate-binding protein [Longispora sp. NPDC051575]|uniref:ABC transporter substrate-binding protein n=1 Tax=Longispora sp. NPDC051575 TaxID=3154943 RepID=UPI00344525AB
MSLRNGPSRRAAVLALVAVTVLGMTAACSRKDDATADGKTKLVIQTFGKPGIDQAVAAFQAAHPDIVVDHQKLGELRDFQPKLVQWLGAGKGAGDVVMLEEGVLLGYLRQPDNFVNLLDHGGGDLKGNFLPWKYQRGLTPDGKKLVGLGTDVGGLAMCYRTDLLAKAGMPTDRAEVARLWPTWEAYRAAGNAFKAKNTGAAWTDSATGVVQPYAMQGGDTIFFGQDNTLIADSNPNVRRTWDYANSLISDGLTAKLTTWSKDWEAGFKKAAFATMPCPAWMTGVIKANAGDEGAGKWDVATIPGGTGNWGGSYFAVPRQSKHPKEAYELAKYLTGKDGQLAVYKEVGAMPSSPQALEDPAFRDSRNEYFGNAPTGRIFADSVRTMRPVFLGARHQEIWESVFMPQLQAVEQGKSTSEAAWKAANAEARGRVG